ncbi:hypothetical protein EV384_3564 [Micromonospora kangleipakensis]|uniref:Uncharacterized protein n=1 Tax=Micromonospora kangleipakensis TaxID=1077942 RepID=A0A4Q8BB63_9ACTN|nr:hypothetical protein EV384_3564 [Micromonospora kangleipakensis]
MAAIPSETLAAYTALVGIVLAADVGAGYGAFRWSAYAIFVVLAFLAPSAGYHRKVTSPQSPPDADHCRFPVLECAAPAHSGSGAAGGIASARVRSSTVAGSWRRSPYSSRSWPIR